MDNPTLGGPVNRISGVVVGIVVDNKDPEGLYRVKVKFPWVRESDGRFTNSPDKEDFLSPWARVATFMAGPERGAFWLPEVEDEVLVAFEHGDVRRPFVVGSLWSPVDKAVHDNKSQGGQNNFRTLFSRSGHVIQFLDDGSAGKEKIILQTKVGSGHAADDPKSRDGHFIVLDHSGGEEKIEIYDRHQKNYLLIDSTNNAITLKSAEGNITIAAPQGTVKIECKVLETKSSATTSLKADSALTVQTNSTADIKSSAAMTIKGSQVKIN